MPSDTDESLQLHNSYWTLRHGQSKANVKGLIVSSLVEGIKEDYALTENGREQARKAGENFALQLQGDNKPLLIFASPFSRTRETAAAVAKVNNVREDEIKVSSELRERFFGSYELQSHDSYRKVWAEDAKSPDYRPEGGGESVRDVAERLQKLIQGIELTHKAHNVLLVAHGDILSICWALVKGNALERHRDVALDTGELRRLHSAA